MGYALMRFGRSLFGPNLKLKRFNNFLTKPHYSFVNNNPHTQEGP